MSADPNPLDLPRDEPPFTTPDAERLVSWLRLAVVATGTVFFPLFADSPGIMRGLGYAIIAASWVYAIVLLRAPFFRWPTKRVALAVVALDSLTAITWLWASGGIDSPWFVIIYMLIFVTSMRLRPYETVIIAAVYAANYVLMAVCLGQLHGHASTISIRVIYMFLASGVASVLWREKMLGMASRLRLLDLSQEVAQVGSWEWLIDQDELRWSSELHRMFGVPADVRPSYEAYLAAVHPDDRDEVQRTIGDARTKGESFRFEHRIVRRDGEVRWLHCRGRVFVSSDGRPREMVGSAQDISERRQIHAELVRTERLASLGTLVSGIAHEINNPLAYIATNLDLMDRQLEDASAVHGRDKEQLRDAVAAARHGAARVRDIVRGLNTSSRVDDNARGPVDLARVADLAIAMVSHEGRGRAKLVREYASVPPAKANESLISQVLVNLLMNALQAVDPGDASNNEIRVKIGTRDPSGEGATVFVEITDTGRGIAPEHMGRIFDPFFTTKPPGEGTGLGLSICHGIVHDMNGEITVESTPGIGSTFRVFLPVASEISSPVRMRDSDPAASGRSSRKVRVLVIDDEVRFAASLRDLLNFDHEVTLENDATSALRLIAAGDRFDVILCDMMMPGMSGMDFYAELSAIAHDELKRVIFLTGGATTERAHHFLDNSSIQHLEKPIELPKLEKAIKRILRAGESAA